MDFLAMLPYLNAQKMLAMDAQNDANDENGVKEQEMGGDYDAHRRKILVMLQANDYCYDVHETLKLGVMLAAILDVDLGVVNAHQQM